MFLALFKTSLPVNITIVFQIIMSIAAFDIIETQAFYDTFIVLPYTQPLSIKFETMGFEQLLIIYNLGSVTLFAIAFFFLMLIMHKIRNKRYHVLIEKGLRPIRKLLFWSMPIRFINESFMVLLIGACINLEHITFWTPSEIINSAIVYIVLGVGIFFPQWLIRTLNHYYSQLHTRVMRYKFGAAYESYDIKKGKIFLFDIFLFFLRRALLVYVVIYKMENLTLQIVVLFSTTLLQIVIIGSFKFYESQSKNRAELLNEVFTMFIMYGTFLFTDYVPDAKVKYDLGYLFSAFIILHLVLNLGIMAKWNFKLSTRAWQARI